MDTTVEQLEALRGKGGEEIEVLILRLNELREKEGAKEEEMPDLTLEKQQLADSSESIFSQIKEGIKTVFDYLVVKPIEWIGHQIKEHPIRTALIALAAFALWYYSAPIAAGLSALKEQGLAITSELLGGTLAIDPAQVDIFDQLVSVAH